MASPTSRTLAVLRKQGLFAQVVERWIPQANKRIDLFGFIDIVFLETSYNYLAYATMNTIVGVQVCAGASHAARRTKILTECNQQAKAWLICGGSIQIRSWSKRKVKLKNGKKADRWTERVEQITLEDLQG